ncbi:MAG: LemA family protein [Saccharofermentanales bacterium]
MSKTVKTLVIILVIVAIIAIIFVSYHNRFVRADESINAAWAQVETQYQRRADLIPNLVNTVKGYAQHEVEVLTNITAMRARYDAADTPEEYEAIDRDFERAINVVVEAYPDLKASEQFLSLQAELAGTENRIAVARRDFNNQVGSYNRLVRTFPGKLFAKMYGFETRSMFQAQPESEVAPDVSF